MIDITAVTLTYCHKCNKPSKCGEIEISEWEHKLHICVSCLMEFVKKIDLFTDKERVKVGEE